MSSLFHETSAALDILKALRDEYPDEQLIQDMIEGETELKEVCSWLVYRIGVDEASIEANKKYQAQLGERCDRLARRVGNTKDRLQGAMEVLGLKSLELDCGTLSLRNAPSNVIITDEAVLPKEYWNKPKPTPNKSLIKTVLTGDGDVPGAALSNAKPSLSIRRK